MGKNARLANIVLAVMVALVVVIGLVPSQTMGAFTAQITSENTAGVKPMKQTPPGHAPRTCTRAIEATAAEGAIFAYEVRVPQSGQALEDLSPSGNTGYMHVSGLRSVFANPCRHDESMAVHFPGKGNKSYIATTNHLAGPDDYTSELWLRTTASEGTLMGFYSSQTPDGGRGKATLKLNIDPITGGLLFSTAVEGGYATAVSTTQVNDGQWHHIVARREAGKLEVFTDGAFVASATEHSPAVQFNGYARIGCDSQTGWPHLERGSACFQGDMAFAAAYDRALADYEITDHYYAAQ